jgi:hypothetical protein
MKKKRIELVNNLHLMYNTKKKLIKWQPTRMEIRL